MSDVSFVRSVDGTLIGFEDSGNEGPAVVLLHGATVTAAINFRVHFGISGDGRIAPTPGPTIESSLVDAGARTVFVHTRGHGSSDKPHEVDRYRGDVHAHDVRAVLGELELDGFDLVGYSMGSMTAGWLLGEPGLRAVVLAGIGPGVFTSESPVLSELRTLGRCFISNDWSEHPEFKPARAQARTDPSHDFAAIGAALIGLDPPPLESMSSRKVPVLILNGGGDDGDGDADGLARWIPDCAVARVAGHGDHALAPSDPAFQAALLHFLQEQWAR